VSSPRVALLLALVAGCGFEHGALGTDAGAGSGSADARGPDGPPGCVSFASQLDTCTLTGEGDLTLSGTNTYDTTTGRLLADTTPVAITRMQIQGDAGPIELLVVHDFHITANARLKAIGMQPLGILAYGTITLDTGAIIDASAGGAGARTSCSAGAIMGGANDGGAGGGGGGGFGGAGGTGGNGDADGTPTAGGTGGVAVAKPAGPLGGCPGAKGGDGADSGGNAGSAGGGLYLVARTRIDIAQSAAITVGGGGGQGGRVGSFSYGDAGGGGGGSGGMIWIESVIVRSDGTLAANGGGGGEASGNGDSGNGGTTGFASVSSAPGGSGNSSSGSDGGAGGALGMPNGVSVTGIQDGGGGGGGGGVGYIAIVSPSAVVTTASPTPIISATF
jgi:hypothetical protein